jgi:hypothetical protein
MVLPPAALALGPPTDLCLKLKPALVAIVGLMGILAVARIIVNVWDGVPGRTYIVSP